MKKKLKKAKSELMGNAMVDTVRLRAALMIACTELTGDPLMAIELAEEFYDMAPELLGILTEEGVENLPAGPAKILPFAPKTT